MMAEAAEKVDASRISPERLWVCSHSPAEKIGEVMGVEVCSGARRLGLEQGKWGSRPWRVVRQGEGMEEVDLPEAYGSGRPVCCRPVLPHGEIGALPLCGCRPMVGGARLEVVLLGEG